MKGRAMLNEGAAGPHCCTPAAQQHSWCPEGQRIKSPCLSSAAVHTCLFLAPALTPCRSSASITEEWPCLQVNRTQNRLTELLVGALTKGWSYVNEAGLCYQLSHFAGITWQPGAAACRLLHHRPRPRRSSAAVGRQPSPGQAHDEGGMGAWGVWSQWPAAASPGYRQLCRRC